MADGSHMPMWSIVLPVHNQADHLAGVVDDYLGALDGTGGYEVLLVPNGCVDDSQKICSELSCEHPGVRVVSCPGAGWGAAVRAGLSAASGVNLCYTNLARTSASDLVTMLNRARANPDAVVKALRTDRAHVHRRVGSALYNAEARALLGVRTRDINATPKIFPRRFGPLLHLTRDDDLIDLEFMLVCKRHGLPVIEHSIAHTSRHGGRSTTGWRTAMGLYSGVCAMRVAGPRS